MRKLEQAYVDDEQEQSRKIIEEIRDLLPTAQGQKYDAEILSRAISSTRDVHLLPLCPVLLATAHLWSALIGYRTIDDDSIVHDVHHCISQALQVLRDAYLPAPVVEISVASVPSLVKMTAKASKRVLSDTKNQQKENKSTSRSSRRTKAPTKGILRIKCSWTMSLISNLRSYPKNPRHAVCNR